MAVAVVKVMEDELRVEEEVCKLIEEKAKSAIDTRGKFVCGVSGGSLQKYLCRGLPKIKTDWQKWQVFFCDERFVSFDNEDSTFKYYKENLLGAVPLPPDNLHAINLDLSLEESAADYEKRIREVLPGSAQKPPRFDMLLLGMGPDGHTASLFPGHEILQETSKLVTCLSDSPKPPPQRVSMTLPLLNAARTVVFASCGEGKAEMIKKVVDPEPGVEMAYPAGLVRPEPGKCLLFWFLDAGAGRNLRRDQINVTFYTKQHSPPKGCKFK